MASGNNVVLFLEQMPPFTLFATYDQRPGGSTPLEMVQVLDFDQSTIEYMDYKCRLDGYNGGGLTFTLVWSSTSSITGNVRWSIAIRRIVDDAEDIDASHTYDYNEVTDTCASASGEVSYCTITFTNGSDMDSWADGELAIIRVRRNASDGADTMTSDAELWGIAGRET